MKFRIGRILLAVLLIAAWTAMLTAGASAAGAATDQPINPGGSTQTGYDVLIAPIIELLESFMGPMLAILGAVGSLYCVLLGIKYARAEEPQEREKAKESLKNTVIGFLLIFVLILGLKLLMPIMTRWVAETAAQS